ncbi:MAG: DUF262 domain-containing protein [Candidatus Cloacimonetes bacterium]|nr:DUF262 domain-containing protein [Candidatus Cloacimonadota bacterium]
MAKIQLSQRMYSILDIIRLLESGELSIQPKYQRRRTGWPVNAKTALIDTIMNNFPLPPIYLRDFVNDKGRRKKEIIDGQQRISTIVEFYKNMFALSRNIFDEQFFGLYYKDLPSDDKHMIEDFEVSFISIKGASESDVISIFSRLNSYSLPLNTQEKRNSAYTGELKTLIYEIASEYNTFWTDFKILSPNMIARMADASLVSDIIYSIVYGIKSSSSPAVDKMYSEFDDAFPLKNEIYRNFNSIITILGNFFESIHIRNIFKPKFMFYSIFLVVYARLYGLKEQEDSIKGSINIKKSISSLEDFCIKYARSDFDPEFKARFKQATGNVAQRNFRHQEISKLIL